MRADRDEIGPGRVASDVDPLERLDRVGVNAGARRALAHNGDDLGQRLDRPDLVVGEHDRDEDDVVGERVGQFGEVDAAIRVDTDRDPAKRLDRVQHGVMFDRGADDTTAAASRDRPEDREVVRLGPAAREHHFPGLTSQPGRDRLARVLERLLGPPRDRVRPRGVAEVLGEERQHRLERLGPQRRRCRVVEIGHAPKATGPTARDQLGAA